MIYLDSSALAKLVVIEDESSALRTWLAQPSNRDLRRVTSVVGTVEVHRLAARVSLDAAEDAARVLARVDRLTLSPTAVALAGRLPPSAVRTLDALHIASAAELPELTHLVSYDHRMLEAAADYGLPVVSPV